MLMSGREGLGLLWVGVPLPSEQCAGCGFSIPCWRRPEHLRSGSGIESGCKDQDGLPSNHAIQPESHHVLGMASLRRARMRTAKGGWAITIALAYGIEGRKRRGSKVRSSGQYPAETSLRFSDNWPSHSQRPDQYSRNPSRRVASRGGSPGSPSVGRWRQDI